MSDHDLAFQPLADSGVLVELPDRIEPAIVARVMALSAALDAASLPGVHDLVPSYRTLLIAFDPARTDGDSVIAAVQAIAATLMEPAVNGGDGPVRTVEIPVLYGGELGADLADVAAHTGLTPAEVCAQHAAATYQVACMGFAPGFGFLAGLPAALATPRRRSPRTRVPAGSVAIGGAQTGVYPTDLPGGWNIIGRTPLRLVDFARPEPFLLAPGDHVRFVPIDPAQFAALAGTNAS